MSKLFDDASLAMIPSAYKDGKLYSIRPTDGSGDFTFSRGSNLAATRVDVNGLIEKGRENDVLYSNAFTGATWVQSNITQTTGFADPFGGSNANKFLETTANDQHRFYNSFQVKNYSIYTQSVYVKPIGRTQMLYGAESNSLNFVYDFTTESIVSTFGSMVDYGVTSVGNGWYRFSLTFVVGGNFNHSFLQGYVGGSTIYAGDVTKGFYAYGSQLEAGLVATDYIETGASTAQAGILEDMPRLDYSGGASCPALLLEPQRTNTTSNSEYFAGGYLANTTLTSNTTTSPDGNQNASTIVSSTSALQPKLLRFIGTAAGASEDQTFSLFVKKYNHRYIQLINEGDADSYANFDIEDGIVGNYGSGTTASIEDYGNGWYRCTIVLDSSHTIAANNRMYLVHSLTQGYANASNVASGDGVYIWGAMQENNSSYPTSYIPTYGSSVTRSVDDTTTLDLSSAGVDGEDVTYFLEFKNNQDIARDSGDTSLRFSSNTSNLGSFRIYRSSSSARQLTIVFQDNGSDFIPSGYEMTSDNPKVAVKRIWSTGQIQVFVDGTEVIDGTNTDMNAWYKIDMEGSGSTLEIKQLVAFPTALTDSECIALTTI